MPSPVERNCDERLLYVGVDNGAQKQLKEYGAFDSTYKETVNNYLNPELFGGYSIQQYTETEQMKARQSILYKKIISPLKRLSEAYQDDWDIQSPPTTEAIRTISHHIIPKQTVITSHFPVQADFTIAIFCALPLEVDAVSAVFDERYEDFRLYKNAPGDTNTYTLGRVGRQFNLIQFIFLYLII
ncbi:hypothetical protein AnigIFM63309_002559 [Aspergillus niger]|nr:hypothetical protein AnigIFM63309_002559 [Aspergillus niger]